MSRPVDIRLHSLSDRRLRYLAEVVATGSMRKAADRCGVEASVISRQIQQLEVELGIPLMEKLGRGVKPTAAADLVLDFFRAKQSDAETLIAQLDELQGLKRGNITIAASEGFMDDLIRRVLKPFSAAYPLLHVNLEHLSVSEIVRRVAENEADIGLAYNPRPDPLVRELQSKPQPVRLIARNDHPLVQRPLPLAVEEILPFPVALLGKGYGLRQAVDMVEQMEKVQFSCSIVVNTLAALKSYVEAGLGLTFLPAIQLGPLQTGNLVALPIDAPVFNRVEAKLLVRAKRTLSPAVMRLIPYLSALDMLSKNDVRAA